MARGVETKAKLADYFFLLRPMILIPVWTFFLLGSWHGGTVTSRTIPQYNIIGGLISFSALIGAIYIINQITDREVDRQNEKLFLIPHSIISLRTAWLEASVLIVISFTIAIPLLPQQFTWVLVASLLLGAAYSLEPVRLKKRALFDVLANAIGNGVLNTLAGWFAVEAPLTDLEVLIPYPLAVASVHLITTLADIRGDRRSGLKTSGVALGKHRGVLISSLLMLIAAIAAAVVNNQLALLASLLSLPAFLIPASLLCLKGYPPDSDHLSKKVLFPAKVSTLIFSITAGFLFPLYIPLLAVIIYLTRLYYDRRFNMNYPSF